MGVQDSEAWGFEMQGWVVEEQGVGCLVVVLRLG